MTMTATQCPSCRQVLRDGARYCSRCGAACSARPSEASAPGLVNHPNPLPAPAGYRPWRRGTDLYYRWRHGEAGPVLGAEAVYVSVFNAGYPLRELCAEIHGVDAAGRELFRIERVLDELAGGATESIEVPSYEVPAEVGEVVVSLVSAEYAAR